MKEAAITVTFDVEDGKKFKNTLRDFGLRGKDVKGDGGVRGDSVEVKGDSKKLKKLVKDAERTGNILRVHDNGQLKEAAIRSWNRREPRLREAVDKDAAR